jgi:hypothetical protein
LKESDKLGLVTAESGFDLGEGDLGVEEAGLAKLLAFFGELVW